ncbi:MAG: hypothetical protein M1820_000315 [Bogoriella megaspora]|nr:MAG: hypothetical protein M1820_000315 [Bogoriella megaspora]
MSSPSEFLTFYRRLRVRSAQKCSISYTRASLSNRVARPFSSSVARTGLGNPSTDDSVKTDRYPDDEHATNKQDKLDIQSENSHKAKTAKARDEGGQATQQKDTTKSTERAKKEHPEAPDVVIGMQDERGGKGH